MKPLKYCLLLSYFFYKLSFSTHSQQPAVLRHLGFTLHLIPPVDRPGHRISRPVVVPCLLQLQPGVPYLYFNPLTSMPSSPNNYFFCSLPAINEPQQYMAEWAGDNTTCGAPFDVFIATNPTGNDYQTEPSQSFGITSTEQQIRIVTNFNGGAIYRNSPTRRTRHVSIRSLCYE